MLLCVNGQILTKSLIHLVTLWTWCEPWTFFSGSIFLFKRSAVNLTSDFLRFVYLEWFKRRKKIKRVAKLVWLDWAIFDILGNNIFNKRIPNDWQLLGLFWKPHSYVKTSLATFWATIGKIGILFTPTSGHTGLTTFPFLLIKELSSERDQCDQIWRNSTFLAKFKKSWAIFWG